MSPDETDKKSNSLIQKILFERDKRRGDSTVAKIANSAFCFFKIGLEVSSSLANRVKAENMTDFDIAEMSVAATNFIFSIELYLKAIHRLCNEKVESHEVQRLYKRLPVSVKNALNAYYIKERLHSAALHSFTGNAGSLRAYTIHTADKEAVLISYEYKDDGSLSNMFKNHNEGFSRWRYIYEINNTKPAYVNFDSLWAAVTAMIEVIDDLMILRGLAASSDLRTAYDLEKKDRPKVNYELDKKETKILNNNVNTNNQ
ncbi:hypothetical protein L0659_21430 [Dyadobacter sp. CY347]|nr:hypothetical protein [Dyadobacter sp. CY347]